MPVLCTDDNELDDREIALIEKLEYYLLLYRLLQPFHGEYQTQEQIYQLYGSFSSDEHYDDFVRDIFMMEEQIRIIKEIQLPMHPILHNNPDRSESIYEDVCEDINDFYEDDIRPLIDDNN